MVQRLFKRPDNNVSCGTNTYMLTNRSLTMKPQPKLREQYHFRHIQNRGTHFIFVSTQPAPFLRHVALLQRAVGRFRHQLQMANSRLPTANTNTATARRRSGRQHHSNGHVQPRWFLVRERAQERRLFSDRATDLDDTKPCHQQQHHQHRGELVDPTFPQFPGKKSSPDHTHQGLLRGPTTHTEVDH